LLIAVWYYPSAGADAAVVEDSMTDDLLDYEILVDDALRHVVREALGRVSQHGMPDGHHFYITFRTDHPGTELADALRAQFEDEMTIVLQHQFSSLRLEDHRFRVTLNFSGVPRTLVVPFVAITAFADPDAKFALQFRTETKDTGVVESLATDAAPTPHDTNDDQPGDDDDGGGDGGEDGDKGGGGDKIVTLDAFRKK
jgi:hypothetical protein